MRVLLSTGRALYFWIGLAFRCATEISKEESQNEIYSQEFQLFSFLMLVLHRIYLHNRPGFMIMDKSENAVNKGNIVVTRSIHVGFVVDKVAPGQGFFQVLPFSPVNIIPRWLSTIMHIIWEAKNSPDSGRSSETQSKPVVLGGLVVIVLAIGSKVRGFKPGQGQ
jgi:hypothetical protein